MAPLPPPVALMDEIVEEILLRVPPDDPARLLHAALVCKRWFRIVSAAGFLRRYREFHRTPPMLGFFRNHATGFFDMECTSSFVSTSSFRTPLAVADRVRSRAIDARHGRVLLQSPGDLDGSPCEDAFHVWDPLTGERRELPLLPRGLVYHWTWNAAVLCATDGCQHLDCHRGPFLVVFVSSGKGAGAPGIYAHIYSSEADTWSQQISAPDLVENIKLQPIALAEDALYFPCSSSVLKYDLATREMSLIHCPQECFFGRYSLLMATEDGGLGLAYIHSRRLCMWSRNAGSADGAGWARRAIELTALFRSADCTGSLSQLHLKGVAHGLDVFLVETNVGIFTIDVKSMRVTKVCEESGCIGALPYMTFCTPALRAASGEGSRIGTSTAS